MKTAVRHAVVDANRSPNVGADYDWAGERYRAYCAAVPRLWPSLLPRLPKGGTAEAR